MAQPSEVPRGQQGTDKLQEHCGYPVPNSWCCLVISKVIAGVSARFQTQSGVNPGRWPARCSAQPPSTMGLRGRAYLQVCAEATAAPLPACPALLAALDCPASLIPSGKKASGLWPATCSVPMCWLEARPQNRCQNLEKKVQRGFISIAKFCPL